VAIPAMMIGHLTFAGLAEAVISAGMVSYLQRADLGLLRGVSGLIQMPAPILAGASAQRSSGRLWWTVALLMLFTPLGILAAGTAWGEWSSADLMNPKTREQIGAASGYHALPSSVPAGIQRLSSLWTAPFPGYAPKFVKNPVLGYLLSAMFGVGILVLASLLTRMLARKSPPRTLGL
jgi:cobalt/nickel transport system permease protein